MKWFGKKQQAVDSPKSKQPGIWVWRQMHLVGDWYVTRFFFTEPGFLDLPDTIGQGVEKFKRAFSECPRVINVSPHESYLAVHWEFPSSILTVEGEKELDAIVETGISVLTGHFGWNREAIRTGEISSDNDLWLLRKREGLGSDSPRWVIGRG